MSHGCLVVASSNANLPTVGTISNGARDQQLQLDDGDPSKGGVTKPA
jgi:hypothetical protein